MVLFHHLMMIQQRCFSEVYRADVTYDGAGRLKTLTGPAGSLLEYTYDADGKELSETTVTG